MVDHTRTPNGVQASVCAHQRWLLLCALSGALALLLGGLTPRRLAGHAVLVIAASIGIVAATPVVASATGTNTTHRRSAYVVRSGDSLWTIAARRLDGRVANARIAALIQRIVSLNADRLPAGIDVIRPGQRLRLPSPRVARRSVRAARPIRFADWSAGPVKAGSGFNRGSGSARVREVQSRLACLGYATGPVAGRFGPATERAVRSFQAARALAVDGVAGPRTIRALRRACASPESRTRLVADPPSRKDPSQVLPRRGAIRVTPAAQAVPTAAAPHPVAAVWTWLPGLGALLGFMALVALGRFARTTAEATAPAAAARRVQAGEVPPPPLTLPAAPTISVVIPTLNEAENLPHVFGRLPSDVDQVVVVDGGSVDGTADVARRLRPDADVIRQSGRGKGDALACGFAHTWGDIIVMLDADGSTDPAEIPRFVEALRAGATFAKGSRFMRGGGSADITLLRRTGNRALSLLVNLLFGTRYTDLCYGYNAFWSHALADFRLECAGFEVETLMNIRAAKAELRIVEVPSFEASRRAGESKLNARRDGTRILRTIVRERFTGRGAAGSQATGAGTQVGGARWTVPGLGGPVGIRPSRGDGRDASGFARKLADGALELDLHVRATDAHELLRPALRTAAPRYDAKGVDVDVDAGDGALALEVDPDRASEVLAILLDNALRYTEPGGRVTLSARRDGADVLLSVQDTGEGLDPDELERIFERFYRVDRSRSRARGGSGIGLTIARAIAEAHGGRLWAESAGRGHGTGFRLRLPAA